MNNNSDDINNNINNNRSIHTVTLIMTRYQMNDSVTIMS